MFRRFAFALGSLALMAPADGGEPGGGAGGGGGGAEPPKAVTLEQVNELVNKALGARDKRFEARLGETLGGFTKTLEERLAALAPKAPEGDGGGDPKSKVDPELVKQRQELDALRKRLEASEKARQDAETKSRSQRADNELQAALTKAGVRPEAMGRLLKSFRAEVSFDDDGNPMLPIDDGATSVDAAIASWAKSDEAKAFMPAPNAGGAGSPRGGANGRAPSSDYKNKPPSQWSEADREAAFRDSLRSQAENGVG